MPLEDAAEENVRCPTCNARQPWSDTCRRCKCDLSLLNGVAETWRRTRRWCLAELRAEQIPRALEHARRAYALCPNQRSARLLAVCLFYCGDFDKALQVAGMDFSGRRGSRRSTST